MTFRAAELREELHTELERILKYVVDFKIHIQGSLENYEVFVADEMAEEFREEEEQDEEQVQGWLAGVEDGCEGEYVDQDGDVSMDD
jgi:kinetochore protein NDC80